MSTIKSTLNNLEAFASQALGICQVLNPKPSQYMVLRHPDKSKDQWLIVIYFPDATQLNEAIKSGVCYEIFSLLWKKLNEIKLFKPLNKMVLFEAGPVPEGVEAQNENFLAIIEKWDSRKQEEGLMNPAEMCGICGHANGEHKMRLLSDEKDGPATDGWITCSEEHCNCFRTWSLEIKETFWSKLKKLVGYR